MKKSSVIKENVYENFNETTIIAFNERALKMPLWRNLKGACKISFAFRRFPREKEFFYLFTNLLLLSLYM